MNNVYDGMKRVDSLIKNALSDDEAVDGLLSELKKILRANIMLVNDKGQVLYKKLITNHNIIDENILDDKIYVEEILNEQLLQFDEIKCNFSLKGLFIKAAAKAEAAKYTCMILPLCAVSERIGTLVIYKEVGKFNRMDMAAAEYVAMPAALIVRSVNSIAGEQDKRAVDMVKSAMDTLSYSELEAVIHIFTELEGMEGTVISSKIADKAGITRSVIVNAIRKLESAGIIESRSLGMKGTFLKVNNKYLISEINKLKG